MTETLDTHAFTVHLDLPYEQARERTEAALKVQGFGIVTELDVQATFKAKLDRDFRPYAILGACNPNLAFRALNSDPQIGLLLPCNVIIYADESGTGCTVSIIDPLGMLDDIDVDELRSVADDAHGRLAQVAEDLAS